MKYKLGEQWIETFTDGKRHMVKVVKQNDEEAVYGCDLCAGRRTFWGLGSCNATDGTNICPCEGEEVMLIDLGIVDARNCLPDMWGNYPKVFDMENGTYCVETEVNEYCKNGINNLYHCIAYGKTVQEAIYNWNRRN